MATVLAPIKPRRKDVPTDKCLCEFCTAKCCRYFALPIETPETFEDFEYIRWFLLHDRATVFKEDDDWYLLVHTECRHLQADYRCGIYDTRPKSAASTRRKIANSKTTGPTTFISKRPSKSANTWKPCCNKKGSRSEAQNRHCCRLSLDPGCWFSSCQHPASSFQHRATQNSAHVRPSHPTSHTEGLSGLSARNDAATRADHGHCSPRVSLLRLRPDRHAGPGVSRHPARQRGRRDRQAALPFPRSRRPRGRPAVRPHRAAGPLRRSAHP